MRKTGFYKNCERCTQPFWCYQYNAHKRRFCSQNCSNKSTSEQQRETKRRKAYNKINKGNWRYNIAYTEWRNKCLMRDGFKCQECGKELDPKSAVVHHRKSYDEYPELRYDADNGVTLCRACHNKIHVLPARKAKRGF